MNSEEHGEGWDIKLFAWFEENKNQATVGVLILVGLGLIVFSVQSFKKQKESKANQAIFALAPKLGASEDVTSSARDYLQVADKYSGTKASSRAVLLAGAAYFNEEQYDKASETFSTFISENPQSKFIHEATLSLAACLDAQGKTSEATTAYEKIVGQNPTHPTAISARLYLGRLKEDAGDLKGALIYYDKIIEDGAGRQAPFEASQRRDRIYSIQPDLNPANTEEEKAVGEEETETTVSNIVEIPGKESDPSEQGDNSSTDSSVETIEKENNP